MSLSGCRKIARQTKPRGPCELCGGIAKIVHHKDENPRNNELSNLENLCKPCHRLRHHHAPDRLRAIRVVRDEFIRLIRRHELTISELDAVITYSRAHCGLVGTRPTVHKPLPKIMPESALRAFFEAIDKTGNLGYQVMFRVLLYTGCRVAELCAIGIEDVDVEAGKIRISRGKGNKDRNVLVPDAFRLTLQAYIAQRPNNRYLFESNQKRHFSTRAVQYIAADASASAGIPHVHPHLLRHQLLSFLTSQKLTEAQIQLISGHASKNSLQVYQHISLAEVSHDYQEAMRKVGI